ncbi:MAG: Mut7-C RNAse domain-containing protein [Candidatus Cloacimonetes bacterium]|nr:Mut7-C RNAse domain-containing protein [Candidatus Cloacimonadota bacterium]
MNPAGKPKFILTENLNKLAKWLRILGYDAALFKAISFSALIRTAINDDRIVLTRSRKQADSNYHFPRRLIRSDDHLEQLKELQDLIVFDRSAIFSRCSLCNRILFEIDKEKIKNLVPEYVYQNWNEFRICRKCGKIYWTGSHFDNIIRFLETVLLTEQSEQEAK